MTQSPFSTTALPMASWLSRAFHAPCIRLCRDRRDPAALLSQHTCHFVECVLTQSHFSRTMCANLMKVFWLSRPSHAACVWLCCGQHDSVSVSTQMSAAFLGASWLICHFHSERVRLCSERHDSFTPFAQHICCFAKSVVTQSLFPWNKCATLLRAFVTRTRVAHPRMSFDCVFSRLIRRG
jgi:hypothetical protein